MKHWQVNGFDMQVNGFDMQVNGFAEAGDI